MKSLRKAILLVLTVLFINACNKSSQENTPIEPMPSTNNRPNEQPVAQNCKVVKGIYYQDGVAFDSVEFIYADTLIVGLNQAKPAMYYTFEYDSGRIVKRNHFLRGATEPVGTSSFSYDAEGRLISIYNAREELYEFSYSAGRLTKVVSKFFYLGNERIDDEYTYIYSDENISRATRVEPLDSDKTTYYDYTYDSKVNHFKKRPNIFLIEPYYFTKEGTLYPYFFSKNNLINVLVNSQPSGGIHQYITNTSGYITEILINNKLAVSYKYECK